MVSATHSIGDILLTGQHPHSVWRCYLWRQDGRGEWNRAAESWVSSECGLVEETEEVIFLGSQAMHPPSYDLEW